MLTLSSSLNVPDVHRATWLNSSKPFWKVWCVLLSLSYMQFGPWCSLAYPEVVNLFLKISPLLFPIDLTLSIAWNLDMHTVFLIKWKKIFNIIHLNFQAHQFSISLVFFMVGQWNMTAAVNDQLAITLRPLYGLHHFVKSHYDSSWLVSQMITQIHQ